MPRLTSASRSSARGATNGTKLASRHSCWRARHCCRLPRSSTASTPTLWHSHASASRLAALALRKVAKGRVLSAHFLSILAASVPRWAAIFAAVARHVSPALPRQSVWSAGALLVQATMAVRQVPKALSPVAVSFSAALAIAPMQVVTSFASLPGPVVAAPSPPWSGRSGKTLSSTCAIPITSRARACAMPKRASAARPCANAMQAAILNGSSGGGALRIDRIRAGPGENVAAFGLSRVVAERRRVAQIRERDLVLSAGPEHLCDQLVLGRRDLRQRVGIAFGSGLREALGRAALQLNALEGRRRAAIEVLELGGEKGARGAEQGLLARHAVLGDTERGERRRDRGADGEPHPHGDHHGAEHSPARPLTQEADDTNLAGDRAAHSKTLRTCKRLGRLSRANQ